jgi:chorismate mutase
VTPTRLAELLDEIQWRQEDVVSESFHEALDKLREQINHIDDELMDLLGQRMRIAERIGEYKRNNGVTILQSNRWNQILEKSFGKGDKLGLSREFITRYLDAVHLESINRQNRVMNG